MLRRAGWSDNVSFVEMRFRDVLAVFDVGRLFSRWRFHIEQ